MFYLRTYIIIPRIFVRKRFLIFNYFVVSFPKTIMFLFVFSSDPDTISSPGADENATIKTGRGDENNGRLTFTFFFFTGFRFPVEYTSYHDK